MKKKLWIYLLILLVIIAGLALIFLITHQKNNAKPQASYPIDSKVVTTVERTVLPTLVPTTAPKILPTDIAKYSEYGYGNWSFGPGLPYEKRLDLMPASYSKTTATSVAQLLNFFTMTDVHVSDKESPAQAVFFGYKGGLISGYSGIMLYTTQFLDAAVQTINALHQQKPFDFGISLGDVANSTQFNELRWFIDVLDGQKINPDSGVKDDPIPGPLNDYQDIYQAAGLDKSIPWYQVLGNHDHFWMGFLPPNDYIKQTLIGKTIINLGNPFTNPLGVDSRGLYLGALAGSTLFGDVIGAGQVKDFKEPPTTPADANRRSLSVKEFMQEFFETTSNPPGHGFSQTDATPGFANYAFEPKSNLPIKVIALDDTQSNDDSNDPVANHFGKGSFGYGHGELDQARYDWLVSELDKGQAASQLMIIAAHEPIGVEKAPSMMAWNPTFEAKLIAKLHTYPNLILWISGHRHLNTVTAMKSPDLKHPELGFWQVETPSLREFPQQLRTFQIVRNSDNTISIFATDVDPAVKAGSFAALSRSYAIAAKQIFDYELPLMPSGSYNAELIKQLTPEMQNKIQNFGTSISK